MSSYTACRHGMVEYVGLMGLLFVGIAHAQIARFDFGVANDEGAHEQAGWTLYDRLTNGNMSIGEVLDPGTGWGVTLNGGGGFARDRGELAQQPGGSFTLADVYVDFVIGFKNLTISTLDPNELYDIQFIMYDDNATGSTAGSTQTVTNITGGANDLIGIGDGVGLGESVLMSDFDFSVLAGSLSPDANGDLSFEIVNDTLNNSVSLINGLIIEELTAVCDGDVTGDCLVNDEDYQIIRQNFWQEFEAREDGDLVNNNFVDFADYAQWKQAPKDLPPSALAGSRVPEPTASVLCLAMLTIGAACRPFAAR